MSEAITGVPSFLRYHILQKNSELTIFVFLILQSGCSVSHTALANFSVYATLSGEHCQWTHMIETPILWDCEASQTYKVQLGCLSSCLNIVFWLYQNGEEML